MSTSSNTTSAIRKLVDNALDPATLPEAISKILPRLTSDEMTALTASAFVAIGKARKYADPYEAIQAPAADKVAVGPKPGEVSIAEYATELSQSWSELADAYISASVATDNLRENGFIS